MAHKYSDSFPVNDSPSVEEENVELSPTTLLKRKMMAKSVVNNSKNGRSDKGCEFQKEFAKYEMYLMAKDDVIILSWWKSHEKTLPLLSKVAKSVLAIPCSSAKSERVFSCA